MGNAIFSHHSSSYNREIPGEKLCWVCYGTDDEELEDSRDWVSPCKCRGTSRWVHQDCVQRWVDEKTNRNESIKVNCPQCNTEFIIVYNEVNYFVQVLNKIEKTANQLLPYSTIGVLLCTLYCSATSYGAITLMQVMGEQEAINMMEDINPYMLLLILPAIPVSLFCGIIINWKIMLKLLVRRCSKLPVLRTIMPSFLREPINISTSSIYRSINSTPNFCAAFLLPTTATIAGKLFFGNRYSNLKKSLLGGLVYIAVKWVFRIYQGHHNAIKERTMRFVEYPDTGN